MSTGGESPIGEPLATLPPSVPAWRIGGDAKRRKTSARLGTRSTSAVHAASSDAPAPMLSASPATSMRFNASTLPT